MADPGRPQPLDAGGERIPAYAFPENAVRALAKVAAYAAWRTQPPGLLWGFDDVSCRGGAGDLPRRASRPAARTG